MTALINRAAVEPLAPVTAALAAFQTAHGKDSLQGITPGLILDQNAAAGFRSASTMIGPDGVREWLDAAARRWSAQPHAAAALAWKCYSYWLALPAVVGFSAARRVPLMTPDQVLVRFSDRQPFLTIGLHQPVTAVLATDPIVATDTPGLLIVEDENELLGVMRRSLADAHLHPMLDEVRQQARLGQRTLWGSVASGVAYAMSRSVSLVTEPLLPATQRLLTALDADGLVDLAERPEGGLDIQRKTCCLAFTLPTPKVCSTCCIRTAG